MSVFTGDGSYAKPLSEVYENEQKSKKPSTVFKFKNKMPKWSEESGSYVLNFYGRASVASIKNFILMS